MSLSECEQHTSSVIFCHSQGEERKTDIPNQRQPRPQVSLGCGRNIQAALADERRSTVVSSHLQAKAWLMNSNRKAVLQPIPKAHQVHSALSPWYHVFTLLHLNVQLQISIAPTSFPPGIGGHVYDGAICKYRYMHDPSGFSPSKLRSESTDVNNRKGSIKKLEYLSPKNLLF